MSEHVATIRWQCADSDFAADRYSRAHRWLFDGGAEILASASPSVVPVPLSDASAVDPEEAFVASLSSCHMLWFLSIARKRGFVVDRYCDHAVGRMGKDARGRIAMIEVLLRPEVRFAGERTPSSDQLGALHHAAHESCFIASSVLTEVRCEPQFAAQA
jgi:organic hydroperoxide reductase OsmC/OhrA